MALAKRSSPSPTQNASTRDLKQRVFTCLNKLSDRDTQGVAATELESIARNLTHDSLSPFISSISNTDTSEKSPVRKQCVRLLTFLSEAHGDALSPYLSKMLATVVRRLRDPDSAVRSACIDAVAAMSSQITKPPFSSFLKPLTDTLLSEQDHNSQVGSALCLASAIDASPDPELPQLSKLLHKLLKLLRCDSFKAKPALLILIASVIGAGGASSHNVLKNLIHCMIGFLSSEDWAARKAAAEAFVRLADVERDALSEFKCSCLKTFETRRFDKVKVVRDTMNQMLEAWKEIPDVSDEVLPPPQSQLSSREDASDGRYPLGSKDAPQIRNKHIPASRSPPPDSLSATTARKRSPLKGSDKKTGPAMFRKLDHKKSSDWSVEIAIPHALSVTQVFEDGLKGPLPMTKRVLFNKNSDDKMHKFGGFRSGSRVVPCHEDVSESTVVVSNVTEDIYRKQKECEDLSLIRKQLVQIENQQSSLLDLLQGFIGSSQNGMRSLETRVHGLELALDEISFDLAVSTGRMSNTDSAGTTCCKLPGAEFLSSKFWRRAEGRYSNPRFSSSSGTPLVGAMRNKADKNVNAETFKLENRRLRLQGGGGFIVNPLAEIHSDSRGISEVPSNRISKKINDAA